MSVSDAAIKIHELACQNEDPGYTDPDSGLFVLTSFHLRERGYCCGNGCRHCPFDLAEQKSANRPPGPAYPYPET